MSSSSPSNYFCHNCGRINSTGTRCNQCQSEFLEEIPVNNEQNTQQISLIPDFQNLFNNNFDIQSFTNMLLLMLSSQTPSDLFSQPHHHRRSRPLRRIKRITHRYLPFLDLSPIQSLNTSLRNINGLVPEQTLNTQYQPNMTFVQVPLQFLIFDQNRDNFNLETLTHLLNEDIGIMPITRDDINQLPGLTMTPSNLSLHPSCAICLENFDSLSDVKQLPICHHVFHTNCLTEWLLRHANCPMCRTRISSNQFFQIFEQQISSDTPQLPHFDSNTE